MDGSCGFFIAVRSSGGQGILNAAAGIHYNTCPPVSFDCQSTMRRPSKRFSRKLSSDSQRLVTFAQAVMDAASRLEERAWEAELDKLLVKLLKSDHQDTIDAALDHTFKSQSGAYDALMESVEAVSESVCVEHDGKRYDALLIAAPILAWTRFSIASGTIAGDMPATLSAHLYAHVLASDTRVALAPTLYAIDQLPRTHAETFALTQQLAQAALKAGAVRPLADPPETAPFLADTRYLLAVVVVPEGAPIFRWQAELNPQDRELALAQWKAQVMPNIARVMPGCGVDLLLPEAYYVACREADKRIRPASIRAAVYYLTHTLNVEAGALQAIVGGFGEDAADSRIDEFRVSFMQPGKPEVVYGLVWPLYGPEDGEPADAPPLSGLESAAATGLEIRAPFEEITALLRECGVTEIKHHRGCFPMDSCDDCGAPLYLDMDAELVHAEMPEDAPQPTGHFH
jgi:hypothetical protein